MPFTSQKARSELTQEVKEELERISHSRTEPAQRIERPKIGLAYAAGATRSEMARQFKTHYPKVDRCINKALQMGGGVVVAEGLAWSRSTCEHDAGGSNVAYFDCLLETETPGIFV